MARLFTPAVACPVCKYPNDITFNFCEQCGYTRRKLPIPHRKPITLNLAALDSRLASLDSQHLSTAYAKQKQSLRDDLADFLYALPGQKTMFTATPVDLCRFLVFKDSSAKSQLHLQSCQNAAKRGISSCTCPRRLAHGTIDSYIGKLRSLFSDVGRQGQWNPSLHLGNPATDDRLKSYLKQVTAEQLQAHSTPKQALPLFPDKLLLLSRYLEKGLSNPSISPSDTFILARDQAFFKALFYSGDRAGDLGLVKTAEIARFPDDSGLLFNHVWGKTLRDGARNLFGMRRHQNPSLCPVRGIEIYVSIAKELSIDLTTGFLFRPTNPQGNFINQPWSSSATGSRLKLYLRQAAIDSGETLHSFRAGCALTLTFAGSRLADVMSHIGWSSPATARYYLQLSRVIQAGAPADLLSQDAASANPAIDTYKDLNHLKNFILAFPASAASSKRLAAEISPEVLGLLFQWWIAFSYGYFPSRVIASTRVYTGTLVWPASLHN